MHLPVIESVTQANLHWSKTEVANRKHHLVTLAKRNFPLIAEFHKYMIKQGRSLSSSWEQIRASSSLCREQRLFGFFFISFVFDSVWRQPQFPPTTWLGFRRRFTSTSRCDRSRQGRINASDLLRHFFCGEGHQSLRVWRFLATHTHMHVRTLKTDTL